MSPEARVLWGHGLIDLAWFSAAARYLISYHKNIFRRVPEALTGLRNFNNTWDMHQNQ